MFLPYLVRIADRVHLRHANAGDDSRRADGSRSDADLDCVDPCIDQGLGPFRRRHISGDQFAFGEIGLRGAHGVQHP